MGWIFGRKNKNKQEKENLQTAPEVAETSDKSTKTASSKKATSTKPKTDAKPQTKKIESKPTNNKTNGAAKTEKGKPASNSANTSAKTQTKTASKPKSETKAASKPKPEAKKVEEEILERKSLYRVLYDKDARVWIIKKDCAKRKIASFVTKEEALTRVKELCSSQDLNFVVHKKDGKFQKK